MALPKKWFCDFCGESIKKVEDGWVEWIEVRKEDGSITARDLRLVHHRPASPLKDSPSSCQFNEREERKKDNGSLSDLPLRNFLGPDGFMYLLSFFMREQFPKEDVIKMIMRLHIPGYERTRRHFDRAIKSGIIEQDYYPGFFTQGQIAEVLAQKWPDNPKNMIATPPRLNLKKGFSKRGLKLLLSSVDDIEGHHVMWVDYAGNVHLTLLPDDLTPAGWEEKTEGKVQFRYATFNRGNGYAGYDAAKNDKYVDELYKDLTNDWKENRTGYIDYHQ
jgi:hypothetical protein